MTRNVLVSSYELTQERHFSGLLCCDETQTQTTQSSRGNYITVGYVLGRPLQLEHTMRNECVSSRRPLASVFFSPHGHSTLRVLHPNGAGGWNYVYDQGGGLRCK